MIDQPSLLRSQNSIVNVPDISPADDDFTHLELERPIEWISLSGLPANMIERRAEWIRISRYRAALQAALAARSGRVVISHLPLMSAATAIAMRTLNRDARHLAFSFNFTDRPTGRRLAYMRHALKDVDQFAVYSIYERELYAKLFSFDENRFIPVVWTQSAPPSNVNPKIDTNQPYFCAIGGEGRDLSIIVEAAQRMPKVRIILIARPRMVADRPLPSNIEVLTNISLARTWSIACASLGVLIPLLTEETCCGHITLVSAKQLGLPVAITRTFATSEYVDGRGSILTSEPGDAAEFSRLLERLTDEQTDILNIAQNERNNEIEFHNRSKWARYVDKFLSFHK